MFTIGEFARFGGISVRMLRHYDEVGLLRPARVDDVTGYRYYSPRQLPTLHRLVALRSLGFGLADIERMLDGVTADELRAMLAERRSQLESEIDVQREQLAGIEARLRLIDKEGEMPDLDIVIKSLPAERVVALSAPAPAHGPTALTEIVTQRFSELLTIVDEADIETGSPAFCFFTHDDDDSLRRVYCALPVDDSVTCVPDPADVLLLPAVARSDHGVGGAHAGLLPVPRHRSLAGGPRTPARRWWARSLHPGGVGRRASRHRDPLAPRR